MSNKTAKGPPEQVIGSGGLGVADNLQIVCCHVRNVAVGCLPLSEFARLQAVDGTVRGYVAKQSGIGPTQSNRRVDAEQRGCTSSLSNRQENLKVRAWCVSSPQA